MPAGQDLDVTAELLAQPLSWFKATAPFYPTAQDRESQKNSEVALFWVLADSSDEALTSIKKSHTFQDHPLLGELSTPVLSIIDDVYAVKPIFQTQRFLEDLSTHPWGRSTVVLFIEQK